MLIANLTHTYGEDFWASGDTIQNVLDEFEALTGDTIHAGDNITWYRATPVKVTCTTKYTIEDK